MCVTVNSRPTYYATPHRSTTGRTIAGRFNVYELRDGESDLMFHIAPRGIDLFQELMKRGIPTDDARTLVYEMT